MLSSKLQNSKVHVVNATSHSDIKAALNMIVNKVQKLLDVAHLIDNSHFITKWL